MQRLWYVCMVLWLLPRCATTKDPHVDVMLNTALSKQMAYLLVNHHAYEPAIPLLQQGLAQNPNDPHLHRMYGIILRDSGLYDQALNELRLAWLLDTTDAQTAAALGVLYDLRKQHDAAEIWHRCSLDLQPDKADFYNNLGFSMYLKHRPYDAITAYHQALQRDPTMRRVYNNLGFAQAELHLFDEAERSFKQGSNLAGALNNLGLAYENQGNIDMAKHYYEESIRANSHKKIATHNLTEMNRTHDNMQ